MSHQRQRNKIGATPGKLALMGVLAVVLVVVIVQQLPPGAADQVSAKAATAQPTETETASSANVSLLAEEQRERPAWPEINLAETLASDPFAPPAWAAEEELAAIVSSAQPAADGLAELQQLGASIVVIADGRKSATVGEAKVRVGDILHGYRVSDITTEGILLDKLNPL